MTVVVHSFVADSSLLDCCDLVVFLCVFSTLSLQVGNRLGIWDGFSCFVAFIWCQLFACLIRAAIFRLPPAFVVWSFFRFVTGICGQFFLSFFATGIYALFLSFMAFSAVGVRVRLFVFAFLALVSGYQCISQKGRKRKKLYTNAYGKERKNRPQTPVAKKERPNHKCGWQTKNGCPNQASKQLIPNERNKTAETTSKP